MSVRFHNNLHGLRVGRGTGTASLKAKMLHQITAMSKEVLYEVFLDLKKAYDALDRYRCLEILVAYGVGSRKYHLFRKYWAGLIIVSRAGRYHGAPFTGYGGVKHGDLLSPTTFNMVVDVVIYYWETRVSREDER